MKHVKFSIVKALILLSLIFALPMAAEARWETTYSVDNEHMDVWSNSANDTFIVGSRGSILRYNGVGWGPMGSPTDMDLHGVWGVSGSDVFAVGASGVILHYDGADWRQMNSGISERLNSVWGSSGRDVFAVGDNGVVLHYDGADWSQMDSGTSGGLYDVWCGSGNDVFAIGDSGVIIHYDGGGWSEMASGVSEELRGVWGSSGSDVYAVGRNGAALRYNGDGWSQINLGVAMFFSGVWGGSANDVFIVGSHGAIFHYDGNAWIQISVLYGWSYAVSGASGSDVFAVGGSDCIFHYDGDDWSRMELPCLKNIWGVSESDVFAVGDNGVVLHYDGANWSQMASGVSENLNGVWGSSGSDVFAVGGEGLIIHYDGDVWRKMSGGTSEFLYDVWGGSGNNVYAVGSVILHYNGLSWSEMTTPGISSGHSVWGDSWNNIFVLGNSGGIILYRGSSWSQMDSGTSEELFDVWGGSGNDVFAVGRNGVIIHYDGGGWSQMDSGVSDDLFGVWRRSGNDVFAVGSTGTILHYDGDSWNEISSYHYNADRFEYVWGDPEAGVFVGANNRIFYYENSPTAITNAASSVADASATLTGSVNPEGESSTVEFEYGPTLEYGYSAVATQSPAAGSSTLIVSADIDGLEPGTVYHFRIKATNSAGTSYGYDRIFTTSGCVAREPEVATGSASVVTVQSATLNGVVKPNCVETTYCFVYGKTPNSDYSTAYKNVGAGAVNIQASAEIAGLDPDTTYYYRLAASNSAGTTLGEERTFRTSRVIQHPKAIIVAGGGLYNTSNVLWDAIQKCANLAYRALLFQGYAREDIYYLSPALFGDVDGDGAADDADAIATNANLEYAIDEWAADADSLLIYMVDHGGNGIFRMGAYETLRAETLNGWLDNYQERDSGSVILVYDACQSGSFLPLLKPSPGKKRILVASASGDENAVFATDGVVSFSFFFWGSIYSGESFYNSFFSAKNGIELSFSQNPELDANGNGIPNEKDDKIMARLVTIGQENIPANDIPLIGDVSPDQTLDGETSALIFAEDVTDANGVGRVWAVITPPGYHTISPDTPITDLPTFELNSAGDNRYEAVYRGFTTEGDFNIAVFASDNGDPSAISLPKTTTVRQNSIVDVTPDIKANGSDDPIAVPRGTPVSISIAIAPGQNVAQGADWWIAELSPDQSLNHFDLNAMSFAPGLDATFQGPLVGLSYLTFFTTADLSPGDHVFAFGVDMGMDGVPDVDRMNYDTVTVSVVEE